MLELYSMNTCPYAQRTRMVLVHKSIPFELIEIDLGNKPDWFLEISPYGKVPALKVGDATLYESAIINEYLDETYPEKRLLSEDPLERASQRILIDFISNRFVPLFYKLLVDQEEAREGHKEEMLAHFDYFESLLRDRAWLSGDEFSLTDLSLLPWFERLVVLEHYRGDFGLPASLAELNRWWRASRERPEFEATKSEPDLLIESYTKYAGRRR